MSKALMVQEVGWNPVAVCCQCI